MCVCVCARVFVCVCGRVCAMVLALVSSSLVRLTIGDKEDNVCLWSQESYPWIRSQVCANSHRQGRIHAELDTIHADLCIMHYLVVFMQN